MNALTRSGQLAGSLLCLLLGSGCAGSEASEAPQSEQLRCARAAEHLQACLGEPVVLDTCDAELADSLLAQDCATLASPGKADALGSFLCNAGILRHCPAPACEVVPEETPKTCADHIGQPGCASCDYYLCREAERETPCGSEGYYVGFGHNYCDRFSVLTQPRMSPEGQAWVDDVRVCLQAALDDVDDNSLSCDEVRDVAYDTHPPCYVETGFCRLPLGDLWAVVNTVQWKDLGFRQPLVTGVTCLRELFDPQSLELSDEGLERLVEAGIASTPSPGSQF